MIDLETKDNIIKVSSPYNPSFKNRVKSLNAKWDSKAKTWDVPVENKKELDDLLLECYGYAPYDKKIVVEIEGEEFMWYNEVKFGGITVAYRGYRDSRAVVKEGWSLIKGELPESGGSAKYPSVECYDCIFRGEVPESVYEGLDDEQKQYVKIVEFDDNIQKSILKDEKAKLLKRLEEINKELEEL